MKCKYYLVFMKHTLRKPPPQCVFTVVTLQPRDERTGPLESQSDPSPHGTLIEPSDPGTPSNGLPSL